MQTYEKEKELLKKAKQLNQDYLGEKIKNEKQTIRHSEEKLVTANLEKEKEKAVKELEDCKEHDSMHTYTLAEVQREYQEQQRRLENLQKENNDMVQPEIQRVDDEIDELTKEFSRQELATTQEKRKKQDFIERREKLMVESEKLDEMKMDSKHTLQKIRSDPDRIRKQADVVERAAENLHAENKRLREKIEQADAELLNQQKNRKVKEETGSSLNDKLTLHRGTIEQRERDVESVRTNLEFERSQNHEQLNRRVELDILLKTETDNNKRELERLSTLTKEFERHKKSLKKKKIALDTVKNSMPQLKLQVTNVQHQLESYRNENKDYRKNLQDLKQEVDIFIAKFLRQEGFEKDKRDDLEGLLDNIKNEESHIGQWSAEEHKQNKMVTFLHYPSSFLP
jgi:hypothetical protein